MDKRLTWNAIGLERKVENLYNRINEDRNKLPEDHLRDFRKLTGFLEELEFIKKAISRIKTDLLPILEKQLRLAFPTPELVYIALTRPSIRNIFDQLKVYFQNKPNSLLQEEEFNELASSGDAANVLALIGDAVLDLAVIQIFWDSSLSTAGDLTQERSDLVSNSNLAAVSDRWNLSNYRLKKKIDTMEEEFKEKKIEHMKATLVEAIFGVVYLEFGQEKIEKIVPLIQ